MTATRAAARDIPYLYQQAQEIAYLAAGGGNSKVSGGSSDPTLDAVLAGFANAEDAEHDVMVAERKALRSAVDAMASAVYQLGLADGRLRSIIRTYERGGQSATPGGRPSQTWTGREAERVASEREHSPSAVELTERRYWPR
ncbi:MAG TPA: hypothetical protein VLE97_01035 [Gaiellaceae bacterium]|nr:hypothetical protein [Gaiellaceae bacterium]